MASTGMREAPRTARSSGSHVPVVSADSLSFAWVDAWHPGRNMLEDFISRVFRDAYGARISRFHDTLIGCADEGGHWIAAVGFSALSHRAAFLEHYLDRPVERGIERVKPLSLRPAPGLALGCRRSGQSCRHQTGRCPGADTEDDAILPQKAFPLGGIHGNPRTDQFICQTALPACRTRIGRPGQARG